MSEITVREARSGDADALADIYNHYVLESVVTFEEEPVAAADMAVRLADIVALGLPWLVAEDNGRLVGYAYASKWRARRGYRFSVETTVYVAPGMHRRGVGLALYNALLPRITAMGFHAAMGGIALPNDASVALHERFGFQQVAHFRETGFKFDRWIDTGYWEKLL